MRLLYLGDIMGKTGRDAVAARVPNLRRELGLDFVVACGENAAHGFGLTHSIAREFFAMGVDVGTSRTIENLSRYVATPEHWR